MSVDKAIGDIVAVAIALQYNLSAATFADTRPVGPNDSDVGKAKNRRIEVVLLPDLSTLPSYEALMKQGRPPRKGKKGHRPPPKRR